MTTIVMLDGELVLPPARAEVSVFDRGFLYGDSVFEALRTYRGVPFALDAHLARLAESAARVFIPLPVELAVLRVEVLEGVRASGNSESYVRLMLTRGIGKSLGLDPALAEEPLRVLIVKELEAPAAEIYEKGISVASFRTQRVTDAVEASQAKIGNYLMAVLAMREARAHGASEALIVDAHGQVLEGATSNVFFVIGGKLVTAPENAGILAGITRAHVLDVARESGLVVELRSVDLAELALATEIFISSSIREIVPVVRVDGKSVGSGSPGPETLALLRAFRAKVERNS